MIELQSITKTFPGVVALDRVSFEIHPGEVHALCGENGAGKSTLMKVLAGVYPCRSYEGRMLKDGRELRFSGVSDATREGIAIVHQELALMPEMTVLDNLFMGNERARLGILRKAEQKRIAVEHLSSLGFHSSLDTQLSNLRIGEQQRLEIARALLHEPAVLVLDEPTSALPEADSDRLLDWIRTLAESGTACVYISHRMDEIFRVADRITVLRDGQSIWTKLSSETDSQDVIAAMVGRPQGDIYAHEPLQPGRLLASIEGLRVTRGARILLDVPEISVRRGEIVGLAGLMGAGRSCLLHALAGAIGRASVTGALNGEPMPGHPHEAMKRGLFLIPEDRKEQALFLHDDIIRNVMAATVRRYKRLGFLDRPRLRQSCNRWLEQFAVKAPDIEAAVDTLSGGNQQKLLLARAAEVGPPLLLLDEPTRGIDVGTKEAIYRQMEEWTRRGWGILWSSSELQELLGISDRVYVLSGGRLMGEFHQRPFDQEAVMAKATLS